MKFCDNLFALLALLSLCSLGKCFLESDGWISLEMHHAIDPSDPEHFSYRGNITIPSLNSGLASIVQELMTPQHRAGLNTLAAKNDNYRVKIIVNYPTGRKYNFLTSTKACNFALSNLNDILWVAIDSNGFVTSVSITTPYTEYTKCRADVKINDDYDEINTDVLIRHTDLAPIPDTATFIQRMEREREARERGEGRDNRGFFTKYWMYILPVVLLLFISGAANQEQPK